MAPRARKSLPVCPVCDSTEYVLRQGEYFCRMCNTQSQELGMETIMDEETAGLAGGLAMCDSMSLGSKRSSKKSDRERLKRRKMVEAESWTTAEAYSWVLRGWVIELQKMDIDVEAAVLQLWALYLRQLKMGFERRGEEGCIQPENLKFIDKLKIVGAAPGMQIRHLAKRKNVEASDEEEFDDADQSIRKRRRMRKKRRDFFQTFSDAESLNESRASSHGTSGEELTSESETDISDDGHITDPMTVQRLMKTFTGRPSSAVGKNRRKLKNGIERSFPMKLGMQNLASLLTLAVISRPGLSVTLEDVARLFNSETLRWHNASTYLPQHFLSAINDIGMDVRDRISFDHPYLSKQVWRMATYLSTTESKREKTPDKRRIVLLNHEKKSKNDPERSQFVQILTRVLADLSLPSSLQKDITRTFSPLHLLTLSTEVGTGEVSDWQVGLPSVLKRLLALILLCLKFHFSLDDQFEYYHSHNIDLIRQHGGSDLLRLNDLQELASEKHFDALDWIRLSKLRLDYLMSRNVSIRDQFESLSHIGTPDLTRGQEIEKLKYVCHPREGQKLEDKWEEIAKLLAGLSLGKADSMAPVNNTTQPLLENTKILVNTDILSPRVKTAMEKLLDMPNFTLTLRMIDDKVNRALFNSIQRGVKRVKLKNNRKAEIKHQQTRANANSNSQTRKKRREFLLEMMHRRIKRSTHDSVTIKSKGSESFAKVTPTYWFSGPLHRTDCLERFSPARQMALDKHVLHGLPDNFSWCLQYFASYAQISNVSLLQELSDIENLILHLDKDYFGSMRSTKQDRNRE